nr:HlyD family efflux transporter periplasmic adaptor subunit [Sphingobium sp. BHU LFT2]
MLIASRETLRQQAVQFDAGRGYAVVAPINGIVTAVTAGVGSAVTSDQAILSIVPSNAKLRAEAYLPSASVANVAPGHEVRIAIDAYPQARFGTAKGHIVSVSQDIIAQPRNPDLPVGYLVVIEIDRPWLDGKGSRLRLLPGMRTTVKIVTSRRTIFQWLFARY